MMFKNIFARLALPYSRLAERLGRTVQRLGRALSRAGVAVETEALRTQRRVIIEEREAARRVMGADPVLPSDPMQLPEAMTKLRNQYSYTVRTTYINVHTGKQESRFLTLSSSDLLSREEIIAEAEEIVDSYDEILTPIAIDVVGAKRAGAAGIL